VRKVKKEERQQQGTIGILNEGILNSELGKSRERSSGGGRVPF
jgi:hypothetical protein